MDAKIKIFLSVLIFFISLILIGQNLDKPFWGEHDWNGVRYGNIARNYLRYGLIETRLGQIENSGKVEKFKFEYYTHYPTLLPLTIGLSYKIFGIREWSTRLTPLLATAGSITLIFFIGLRLYDLKIGVMGSLLALFTPMSQYFGKNASHEPLTLFFILLSFYGYISLGKIKQALPIFITGLILAEATAWAGYFLIPAITMVALLKREFKEARRTIPFWFLSIFIFLIHVGHVYFLTGSFFGGNLLGSLIQRSGIISGLQPEEFNLFNYLDRIRLWSFTLYTAILTLLSVIWVVSKMFTTKNDSDWKVIILAFIGLIYLIVFSNAVFIHNYLIFYFLPFLALSGALTLKIVIKLNLTKKIYIPILILVFLAIFLERRAFLKALNESQGDKFAVEVGKQINRQTNFNDKILVSPINYSYSADKFLRFYSDRNLVYSDNPDLSYSVNILVDQQKGKFEIIKK